MPRYIVSRLAVAAMMAVFATLVIFLIANTVPGDPVLAQLGDLAASNKEFVADWRAKCGLDLPLWRALFHLPERPRPRRSRHLDRHRSARCSTTSRNIAPATIELATVAIPALGRHRHSARHDRRGAARQLDRSHAARFISLIGVSSPTFWLAFIMLAIFYGDLQIAPGPGPHRRHRLSAAESHRPLI